MNPEFRYIFQRTSKKHFCPDCRQKKFVRYIDTTTGQLLPPEYGKCDRTDNCGYWLNPYKNGYAKKVWQEENEKQDNTTLKPAPAKVAKPKHVDVSIPLEVLTETLTGYEKNTFINNLIKGIPYAFPIDDIKKVISSYALGTIPNGYRAGAITFPYIDSEGNIHAIQVKEFDQDNHTTGQGFYHSMLSHNYKQAGKEMPQWLIDYEQNEKRVNCFFGAHLLNRYPTNTIALVEAPKTAIYGSLFFGLPDNPDNLLWLAVYNKSSLTADRFKVLQGRNVILFPDDNAFELWSKKADTFKKQFPGTSISISDLIEGNALKDGGDLADIIVNLNPNDYMKPVEKLQEMIRKQFDERMKIEYWVIDPVNFPVLTKYNIDILIQDIEKHHSIKVTQQEYLEAFRNNKLKHPAP